MVCEETEAEMATIQYATQWSERTPLALKTGLDETVEFRAPEQSLPSCSLRLGEQAELLIVIKGFVAGEAECPVDLDEAVDDLLMSLEEDPAMSRDEMIDDVSLLTALAGKFHAAGARLLHEARRRETEISSE
jgi:hypothetical protein